MGYRRGRHAMAIAMTRDGDHDDMGYRRGRYPMAIAMTWDIAAAVCHGDRDDMGYRHGGMPWRSRCHGISPRRYGIAALSGTPLDFADSCIRIAARRPGSAIDTR